MLLAAKEGRWDEIDELEAVWRQAIRNCASNNGLSKQRIRQLLDMNNEIIGLIQQRRDYIAHELAGFNKGRKAIKAYNGRQ